MINHILYLNQKVAYSDTGEGKVIVFLHGFLESKEIWEPYIERLAKKYRVIAIDLPGHGRSDVFHKTNSMEMMAKVVKHVLDVLEINKCCLLGHSMGGYVALTFAEQYPKQLKGLGLMNSTPLADAIEKKKDRLRAVELVKNDRLNYISEFINKLFAPENLKKFKNECEELKRIARNTRKDGATAALLGMRERKDRTTILQQIKVPVVFIYGMKDPIVSFEKNLPLAMLPKKNYIGISEHSAHLSFIEDSEATFVRLKEILQDLFQEMKRIIVFTGSGISAESGIKTFRDSGGLWEEYRIEDVATPEAWQRNPTLVLDFYNQRRRQIIDAKPNAAHLAIAELQKQYDVQIITQNIDDLHERAGSQNVLHLHGEIRKSRSTINPSLVYTIEGTELLLGDKCKLGSQLRPHIVWFGEQVPMMDAAITLTETVHIFIVIGTSLQVYPAAGLISHAPFDAIMYLIDPNAAPIPYLPSIKIIKESAGTGVPALVNELLKTNKRKN